MGFGFNQRHEVVNLQKLVHLLLLGSGQSLTAILVQQELRAFLQCLWQAIGDEVIHRWTRSQEIAYNVLDSLFWYVGHTTSPNNLRLDSTTPPFLYFLHP